jgi:hypothetical protein
MAAISFRSLFHQWIKGLATIERIDKCPEGSKVYVIHPRPVPKPPQECHKEDCSGSTN